MTSDPYNFDSFNCFPTEVPTNDLFWSSRGRTCIDFIRTVISPAIPNCEGGKREQMNAITHWLAMSMAAQRKSHEKSAIIWIGLYLRQHK